MTGDSLQKAIVARLDERPDARCLALYDSASPRWMSRETVYRRASAAAERLRSAGAQPGDICPIVLPSGETAATALLGALFVGAVPLLLAPPSIAGAHKEREKLVRRVLLRTRPRLVVCSEILEPARECLVGSRSRTRLVFDTASWPAEPVARDAPVLPRSDDVALMQLTSGTTGSPRICVWDHRGVLAALEQMAGSMRLSSDDVCLNWTPLYHDMGLVNNFLLCLATGSPLALLSPETFVRRPALWLRGLSDTRATISWSPNFGFAITARRTEAQELAGVRLDSVRALWNAAERIDLETVETFRRRFAPIGLRPDAIQTNYGCAENVGGATFGAPDALPRYEHVDRRLLDQRGVAQPVEPQADDASAVTIVSVGRPNIGVTVHILSPHGRPLPDGHVGEISLDSPSRMLCYYRRTRDSSRVLRNGLLHTGDLGYMRNGELFWVGRRRERITVRGSKIDPSAFERVLASAPGVREGCFAAFGIPDPALGTERVIVVTEVRATAGDVGNIARTIQRQCFIQLGIAPAEVIMVPSGTLVKTSSGKRRHRYARHLYLSGVLQRAALPQDATAVGS